MELRARIIEGTDVWFSQDFKNGKYELVKTDNKDVCITAGCLRPQDAFNALYDLGNFLWDSNLCSKYEIAAFEGDKMFWKHRPDQYNFERNKYRSCFDKIIKEEYAAFSSPDFQNDRLEMEYIQDYQKRFWDNKTTFCSVENFKPIARITQMQLDDSLADKIAAANAIESTNRKSKESLQQDAIERA